jgi:hypothetical protein
MTTQLRRFRRRPTTCCKSWRRYRTSCPDKSGKVEKIYAYPTPSKEHVRRIYGHVGQRRWKLRQNCTERPKTPREKRYGRPEVRWMRPLRDEHYYMDGHGTIHRRQPKRDKGISARQWKKTRNRSGRSVVAMAASAELLEARKLSSEEICLKFRVPLHQVGLASPPA